VKELGCSSSRVEMENGLMGVFLSSFEMGI
jgi:hypothetical protein